MRLIDIDNLVGMQLTPKQEQRIRVAYEANQLWLDPPTWEDSLSRLGDLEIDEVWYQDIKRLLQNPDR